MRYSSLRYGTCSLVLLLLLCSLALAQVSPCSPVSNYLKSLKGFDLKPGEYEVTLVSTFGKKKGATASRKLTLITATKQDISPKTGKRVYEVENLDNTPLYGSVGIEFSVVNAPVFDLSKIVDPVYPDVLVYVIDFKGVKRQPVVVIGSAGNRRDGVRTLDGSGIGLFVQEISKDGFAGYWDAWGMVAGDKGHFCARRITNTLQ